MTRTPRPRRLIMTPGTEDHFTVYPGGSVYRQTPGRDQLVPVAPGTPNLWDGLRAGAWPHDGLPGACTLRARHSYPPRIDWSWAGARGRFTEPPERARAAVLGWLAAAVLADIRASDAGL